MSTSLLVALTKYYELVDKATKKPAIIAPSGLDFVPGPGEDLESMIWVLTYAIILHHHAGLQGYDKTDYKRAVIDNFYGSLSYSGLAEKRKILVFDANNPLAYQPENWIPDPAQREWFRRAMALVEGQIRPLPGSSTKHITFDAFNALCDEFITDE